MIPKEDLDWLEYSDEDTDQFNIEGLDFFDELKNSDYENLSYKGIVKIDKIRGEFWVLYYKILNKHMKQHKEIIKGGNFFRNSLRHAYIRNYEEKKATYLKWKLAGLL